jgi:hypothetical protein
MYNYSILIHFQERMTNIQRQRIEEFMVRRLRSFQRLSERMQYQHVILEPNFKPLFVGHVLLVNLESRYKWVKNKCYKNNLVRR